MYSSPTFIRGEIEAARLDLWNGYATIAEEEEGGGVSTRAVKTRIDIITVPSRVSDCHYVNISYFTLTLMQAYSSVFTLMAAG